MKTELGSRRESDRREMTLLKRVERVAVERALACGSDEKCMSHVSAVSIVCARHW